jgi:hypothetical protein
LKLPRVRQAVAVFICGGINGYINELLAAQLSVTGDNFNPITTRLAHSWLPLEYSLTIAFAFYTGACRQR